MTVGSVSVKENEALDEPLGFVGWLVIVGVGGGVAVQDDPVLQLMLLLTFCPD